MPTLKQELVIFKNVIEGVEQDHELHTASENIYLLVILSRLMYCRLRLLSMSKHRDAMIVTENRQWSQLDLEKQMKLRINNLLSTFESYRYSEGAG
jgi:hypothetical protein